MIPRFGLVGDAGDAGNGAHRRLLIDTIDRLNASLRNTAQAAGCPRVVDVVFISLEPPPLTLTKFAARVNSLDSSQVDLRWFRGSGGL